MAATMDFSIWAAVWNMAVTLVIIAVLLVMACRAVLGPNDSQQRLGARAQAALRRYRTLANAAMVMTFVVIVLGALVSDQNAMWSCLELPVCSNVNDMASLQLIHRIATLFVAAMFLSMALQTWRFRPELGLKATSVGALSFTLAQFPVGYALLLAGRANNESALAMWGNVHYALSLMVWLSAVAFTVLAWRAPRVQLHVAAVVNPALASKAAEEGYEPENPFANRPYTWKDRVKDYVSLTKPGVITLLIFTTIVSMYITPAGMPSGWLVLWTFIGGWLMSAGAHSINCYVDRDIDVLMGRTSRRPIPNNRIPAWHALVLGLILSTIAFVILYTQANLLTAVLALAGMLYYVFIYTLWLKRTSVSNIVIGGGAGAFPPLVGWAAVTGDLTLSSLFLFAIVFYWTPPHFWALALIRSKDYARAGVPMLPVVAGDHETKRQILLYTLQLFVLTLMLTPLKLMGMPYLIMAVVLGGIFIYYAVRLLREGTTGAAWGLYRFSLLYLALLFTAMVVDRVVLA
jgi:protoheme IX farnesyltransferase